MQETTIYQEKTSRTGWVIGGRTAVFITLQLIIDIIMGGEAEYFNAHATILQLTSWLHGRSPDVPMIAGQEQLGGWALPLATAVLMGVPLLVSTLLVKGWQWIRRQG